MPESAQKPDTAAGNPAITYDEARSIILSMLHSPVPFEDEDNLIEFGLDSLKIMRIVNKWRKAGARVTFAEMIESPRLKNWWALLNKNGNSSPAPSKPKAAITLKTAGDHGPFPLTDVQHAYWIGRRDDQPLGGVGCHAYLEIDGRNVDPGRLQAAWKQVTDHHPMLRARFLDDGRQEIPDAEGGTAVLPVHDLRSGSEDAVPALERTRDRLSHRRLAVERGEAAGLEISLLPGDKTRLHFDIDLLVADVQSLHIILRDLAAAYARQCPPPAPENWSFASYLKEDEARRREERERAGRYWRERLPGLPGAPGLPLKQKPEAVKSPVFKRRTHLVARDEWSRLQQQAAAHRVTPAMVLLTAYAEILDRWSAASRFLINIPLFDRQTGGAGIEDAVADFTNLLLLAVDFRHPQSFSERVNAVQARFHEDVANAAYSGVQVQRDLAQIRQGERMIAPVVFASNLGTPLINDECRDTLGSLSYMISQTPQVWLDFQIYEMDGELLLAWDAVDALFPDGLIDDMFAAYARLIEWLAKKENDWQSAPDTLPADQRQRRVREIAFAPPAETKCLHIPFFDHAAAHPDRIALIDSQTDTRLAYGDLAASALRIAAFLRDQGVGEGDPVAVTLPRGVDQIEGVLGILASGACYVPVSPRQPAIRRERIHQKAGIRYVLTDGETARTTDWPGNSVVLDIAQSTDALPLEHPAALSPDRTAYIIFTSGSTGEPKGVEIAHGSAWNTISEINRRYAVTPDDRALAVSALDFDLSVYDIFGLLGAGGSLVLIPESARREAAFWIEAVRRHRVTLWNSVPVLLDMLLVAAEGDSLKKLPLRQVMLSGDWIGLDLPPRLERVTENCGLAAMGGATEASIWSNCFDVTLPLPGHWTSIPYGRPLPGQAFRIVDSKGRDCPDWAAGELWIGGVGVAKGYRGEPELTSERFVEWNGSVWYRTGDLGRCWPDDMIEFLGREDSQVKIRGHRIELGEIEGVMKRHAGVRDAVVTTADEPSGGKRLIGYVVSEKDTDSLLFDIEKADEKARTALWDGLMQIQREKAEEDLSEKAASAFWELAERLSLVSMCRALTDAGLFTGPGEEVHVTALADAFGILSRHLPLVERWLAVLEAEKMIKKTGPDTFVNPRRLPVDIEEIHFPEELAVSQKWREHGENLGRYLKLASPHLVRLLKGDVDPLALFFSEEPQLAPEYLMQALPGADYTIDILRNILKLVREHGPFKKPLRILEAGARTGTVTQKLLPMLASEQVEYTCTDVSAFFTDKGKEKFGDFDFIRHQVLDIDQDPREQGFDTHGYDIVIAPNALHRACSVETGLNHLRSLLAPGGLLLALEMTGNTRLQQISAGFMDAAGTSPLLSFNEWEALFRRTGFEQLAVFPKASSPEAACYSRHVIAARTAGSIQRFNPKDLDGWLGRNLPEYMIPAVYIPLDELPLTANGKVDRSRLPVPGRQKERGAAEFIAPGTPVERSLADIWRHVLNLNRISIRDPFFQLGGDSLLAVQLTTMMMAEFNVTLSLERLFELQTIAELAEFIDGRLSDRSNVAGPAASLPQITPDESLLYEPFPLTDVQQAYWIGRSGVYELGGVSTHCYFEIEGVGLDPERISRAWQRLIDHHPMMRAVILPDGQRQRILKTVPPYRIRILDLRGKDAETAEAELMRLREEMSHQVISTDQWPLFDVRLSRCKENLVRLHISFDNLIFDGWSMFHLLREWTRLYADPEASLPALDLSFRDYVSALEECRTSEHYHRDRAYWTDRLPYLPKAPDLPLAQDPGLISDQRFSRLETRLAPDIWHRIKKRSRTEGVTPSGILLAAYAEMLAAWCRRPQFIINLTLFNRLPLHPRVNDIVGDFTSLTLLAVDCTSGETFLKRARNLQRQLWQDLDHPLFSGVEVQRELARHRGQQQAAAMPVVFTSALGMEQDQDRRTGSTWMGRLVYNITQTPQVWLDHQVLEQDGELVLIWDAVQGLFPPGLLEDMFSAYWRLLTSLAGDAAEWEKEVGSLVSVPLPEKRTAANAAEAPVSGKTLTDLFADQAALRKSHPAVIAFDRRMNYGQLDRHSGCIARALREKGVAPGQLVAVVMEKGWEQTAAVLGILKAGAAYLPVDAAAPGERQKHLLENGEITVCLTQPRLKTRLAWPETTECMIVDAENPAPAVFSSDHAAAPEDLAYVIYTSGSTGLPKGVMIDHQGAVNTISDINRRFSLKPEDRVLALSNLNFDLSVYDIFGLLACGGTIVMPEAARRKDPAHWLDLMHREKVTVWNTVPALMQMLVEHVSGCSGVLPESLRLVLMSGDWIPLDLPDKIKKMGRGVEVISLGGATEASIWSNLYPIKAVDPKWKSIPYGRPMINQQLHVLNGFMDDCPVWVPGRLYIGGIGVSRGYWKDEEKTRSRFIVHPKTNERLYCTGDLARWMPDGNIEFLGREDFQVKIDGYRIELGEIESVLKKYPGLKNALVSVVQGPAGKKMLAAYVIRKESESAAQPDSEQIRRFLEEYLPGYMIPQVYIPLEAFPMTENGKIDRKSLPEPAGGLLEARLPMVMPRTFLEKEISGIWKTVLGIGQLGVRESFFELGGDSLLAVTLVNAVNRKYPVGLCLPDLFAYPDVESLSVRVAGSLAGETGVSAPADPLPVITPDAGNRYEPFPLTDVQQAYLIGRSSAYELGNVATHIYAEFDRKDTDIEQLNAAFEKLIAAHDMMRMVILPGGRQKILEKAPSYKFEVMDCRSRDAQEAERRLTEIREQMSHQMLPVDQWPLFDIRISVLAEDAIRIHLSFDALVVDAWSLFILLKDWCDLYDDPNRELETADLSFRDYVLAQGKVRKSSLYQRDRAFTADRLPTLPPFPALPMTGPLSSVEKPRFERFSALMEKAEWEKLKQRAAGNGLTPSGILLGIYALVLAHYSRGSEFTLNLTLFNRLPIHDQVNRTVGDFTSLTLLPVRKPGKEALIDWLRSLQTSLWNVVEHRYFSGVDMIREFSAMNSNFRGAAFPVVFTSALGFDGESGEGSTLSRMGDFVYGITQTPQVALDHQVMERDGDLLYNWDVVVSLFPEGMIRKMFDAYGALLTLLAENDAPWNGGARNLVPGVTPDSHPDYNDTDRPVSPALLHTLFEIRAAAQPGQPAVVTKDGVMDYGTLHKYARHIGGLLTGRGSLIAVMMHKGWEQVAAVLGILKSGAAYLPLDPDLPESRAAHILAHAGVGTVLTRSAETVHGLLASLNATVIDVDRLTPEENDAGFPAPSQKPEDLAYVIYTSGSTGLPKGVMIDHKGAVNTILDVNERFGISADDKVFALSELSFDLSVYDIFGTLAAGGTIVMPAAADKKDPARWMEMIEETGVTVWNSVPMLMQMLVEHASGSGKRIPASLDLVLLSGDWIPPDLPGKIRAVSRDIRLISLGGATEASIWSIFHPIDAVKEGINSIPYGRPMKNQKFYVFHESMQKCPDWVPGDLYIGGIGLAKGYFNDPERTNRSFVRHPDTGTPLYRTGDIGCYRPDGYIEFLGRDDFQVKVGGYRIELGEIETALKRHPQVENSAAKLIRSGSGEPFLAAYAVTGTEEGDISEELKTWLRREIPAYMVPNAVLRLDRLPLSANGKVDRKALPEPDDVSRTAAVRFHPPETQIEKNLAEICGAVIGLETMDVETSFFNLGASSLHLVQIQNEMKNQLNTEVSIADLFAFPTIRSLAGCLSRENENSGMHDADRRAERRRRVRNKKMSNRKLSVEKETTV